MKYLSPWLKAIRLNPQMFKAIMVELGVNFDTDWADKQSITMLINQLCGTNHSQKRIWQLVYDCRKSLNEEYDDLFPPDPEYQRKRNWCYISEAWFTIAIHCVRAERFHVWIRHFNLDDNLNLTVENQEKSKVSRYHAKNKAS